MSCPSTLACCQPPRYQSATVDGTGCISFGRTCTLQSPPPHCTSTCESQSTNSDNPIVESTINCLDANGTSRPTPACFYSNNLTDPICFGLPPRTCEPNSCTWCNFANWDGYSVDVECIDPSGNPSYGRTTGSGTKFDTLQCCGYKNDPKTTPVCGDPSTKTTPNYCYAQYARPYGYGYSETRPCQTQYGYKGTGCFTGYGNEYMACCQPPEVPYCDSLINSVEDIKNYEKQGRLATCVSSKSGIVFEDGGITDGNGNLLCCSYPTQPSTKACGPSFPPHYGGSCCDDSMGKGQVIYKTSSPSSPQDCCLYSGDNSRESCSTVLYNVAQKPPPPAPCYSLGQSCDSDSDCCSGQNCTSCYSGGDGNTVCCNDDYGQSGTCGGSCS